MTSRITVNAIHFFDQGPFVNAYGESRGRESYGGDAVDGIVEYRVEPFNPAEDGGPTYAYQPFGRNRVNRVWGWDGNREAPSLDPSFLWNPAPYKHPGWPTVHLYLRRGKIDLCADSEGAVG